ncbi:hypothetical protein EJB05_21383 [Eragrostis curvula]|uniref:Uncharacterized protein n=1 Tax=Eragrostis curvula TaxID=38414 RepID=A0A5J9V1K5_9POAL|nr:hypothetical protein EJB05_21383 [Eragrostis curvula]
MGAETMCNAARRCCSFLISVMLCFQLLHHQSQAFKLRVGYGGEREEKVPLAVIVPDPTPQLSSPAPVAAPPPLSGGGDDDMRPRLPTERWRRGHGEARRASTHHGPAPAAAHRAPAPTTAAAWSPGPAPEAEAPAGTALIKSSPAVPVPRGVTDTATILPMPAPGEKRQDAGAATSVGAGMVVPLLMLGLAMMASFGL